MDAIKDLSTVTSISYNNLLKLCSTLEDIICHDVKESQMDSEYITEVDIGIGKIFLFVNDEIKYRFEPSSSLEAKLIKTISDKDDVMVQHVEESFKNKIINNYKDLF